MNLNEFAKEVHQNAVAHGWWGQEYTKATVISLIHAEISEAFEEWRAGRPMMWRKCAVVSTPCGEPCARFFPNKDCKYRESKPEGIAVELIDVVLRILDTAAAHNYSILNRQIDKVNVCGYWMPPERLKLPELTAYLHAQVTEAGRLIGSNNNFAWNYMSDCVSVILTWLRSQNIDPEALLLEKHEYNKGRPYRHGGKRC